MSSGRAWGGFGTQGSVDSCTICYAAVLLDHREKRESIFVFRVNSEDHLGAFVYKLPIVLIGSLFRLVK